MSSVEIGEIEQLKDEIERLKGEIKRLKRLKDVLKDYENYKDRWRALNRFTDYPNKKRGKDEK